MGDLLFVLLLITISVATPVALHFFIRFTRRRVGSGNPKSVRFAVAVLFVPLIAIVVAAVSFFVLPPHLGWIPLVVVFASMFLQAVFIRPIDAK